MYSFCRLVFLLALGLPAIQTVQAQSSSSIPPASAPDQAQAQQSAASQISGQLSVQARIRARREQRRAAAIREAYSHRYEGYLGGGYLRFRLPSPLQRVNELNWDGGFTRFFDERLGVTVDGRGIYGTAFVPPNSLNIDKPAMIEYTGLIGPTYRFYMQPKYSISGRAMGGFAYGNFSGDTGGDTARSHGVLGLYPDGSAFAASVSIVGEYNVAPNLAVRVAPEYFLTGFGSSMQNDLGFTAGIVYRFGKQK